MRLEAAKAADELAGVLARAAAAEGDAAARVAALTSEGQEASAEARALAASLGAGDIGRCREM